MSKLLNVTCPYCKIDVLLSFLGSHLTSQHVVEAWHCGSCDLTTVVRDEIASHCLLLDHDASLLSRDEPSFPAALAAIQLTMRQKRALTEREEFGVQTDACRCGQESRLAEPLKNAYSTLLPDESMEMNSRTEMTLNLTLQEEEENNRCEQERGLAELPAMRSGNSTLLQADESMESGTELGAPHLTLQGENLDYTDSPASPEPNASDIDSAVGLSYSATSDQPSDEYKYGCMFPRCPYWFKTLDEHRNHRAEHYGPNILTESRKEERGPPKDGYDINRSELEAASTTLTRANNPNLLLTDEVLVGLTSVELNKLLQDRPESECAQLKSRRRTLKNRGYAKATRVTRVAKLNQAQSELHRLRLHIAQLRK